MKAKFDYSAAALEELASLQEAKASEAEGGMGKRSLAASLGDVLEESTKTKAATKEFIRKMDKNGDGQVSQEELKNYVNEKGGNVTMVEQLIKTLDKNGDGQVSMAEFEDLVY